MVFVDLIITSILSVSDETLEISCAEALAPWARDSKPEVLQSLLCLMCNLRIPYLSCMQF